MKIFSRLLSAAVVCCLVCCLTVTAFAAGSVRYDGRADEFLFAPGSKYSPTDLFDSFKSIMPGDTLFDQVEVRATPSSGTVVMYMRATGIVEESKGNFLGQLQLKVTDSRGKTVFDDTLDRASEYVCLGSFQAGTKDVLDLTLFAPLEMDNPYQEAVGKLGWEFLAEEHPGGDVPKTGDSFPVELLAGVMVVSACGLVLLAIMWRRKSR